MQSTVSEAKAGHLTGYGSASYRHYVLLLLMLVYTLNFIDRTLIAVVAQPIIESFQLTDAQWGCYGPPFAIFYAVMGLPIALWADRSNRVHIISLCIVLWSIMTALCGVAIGFFTLLMFRIGVAIGEAGCTPPANSLIGDYFIARKRATALGVYSMGVTLGSVLANVFGGPIAQMQGADVGNWLSGFGLHWLFGGLDWANIEGWRIAFVVVGLPGVLVAMLVWITIKEPPRGYSDPPSQSADRAPDWSETFAELKRKPSFWWMAIAASLVAFVGYGLISFQAPFLQREHGLSVRDAALQFGAPLSLLAAVGTFLGGYITERATERFDRHGLGACCRHRAGGARLCCSLLLGGPRHRIRTLGYRCCLPLQLPRRAVQHRSGRRQQSLTCNRHRRAADPRFLNEQWYRPLFRGLHE